MKTQIKNNLWLISLTLAAAFILAAGCIAPKPAPDPLVGWKRVYLAEPDKAIAEDYRDYIQNLPPNERKAVGPVFFFEDGTGQHAIRFEIGINGTDWAYVLIYNKESKRIKVIKYFSGYYRS